MGWPYREFTMRFCRRLLSFAERFKKTRALVMRFFRHGGIYRSDVSSHLINLGPGSRFTVGSGPGYRTRRKNTPCPSSAMSSGRLFLDRVARQHCPSPLHRHTQINMHLSLIHISEPTRLGMISYAVFCLKKKKQLKTKAHIKPTITTKDIIQYNNQRHK